MKEGDVIVIPTSSLFDKNLRVLWADAPSTIDSAAFLIPPFRNEGGKLSAFGDSIRCVATAMCHHALELRESVEGHEFVFLFPLWELEGMTLGEPSAKRYLMAELAMIEEALGATGVGAPGAFKG